MGFELLCFNVVGGEIWAVFLVLVDERVEQSPKPNVKILKFLEFFIINLFNYDLALINLTYMKQYTNIKEVFKSIWILSIKLRIRQALEEVSENYNLILHYLKTNYRSVTLLFLNNFNLHLTLDKKKLSTYFYFLFF